VRSVEDLDCAVARHTLQNHQLNLPAVPTRRASDLEKSKNASHLCHLKRSDLHMSYAVCRMQKVKSAGLKGMQFHNQRERESRTNEDIDRERTHENYDLQNDENINYNE